MGSVSFLLYLMLTTTGGDASWGVLAR